ncbi:MAG: AMP-binding protein [Geodermatophilaceae bacterium]
MTQDRATSSTTDAAPVGNLADLVTRAAARHGSRTAFVHGAERPTWTEFDAAVSRLAAALTGCGLRPGERLAVMLPNTLDFPLHYFAALRAGLVVVPVNNGYTAPELRHVLADSAAAALVTDEAGSQSLADIRSGLPELRQVLSPASLKSPGASGKSLAAARGGRSSPS